MISIPMLVSLWLSVALFPTVEILLILVDCYFRFPFVKILKSVTSAKNFLEHGLPKTLRSDYWVQFTSNEMEHFFKSMVLPIIALHCYGPKQVSKLSELMALLRKLYNLLLTKDVIGNMKSIRVC